MTAEQPAPGQSLRHIDHLDGWRGLAITLLLVGHFVPVPGINFGAIGVNLFFVLSGLLMASLLFEKKEPLARFYRRRVARIIPAHVTFILLITVVHLLLGLPLSVRETLAALFFVNNYVLPEGGPGTAVLPFGHIWSLSVEEHSYVALSLVAIAARRGFISASTGAATLLGVATALSAFYYFLNPPHLPFTLWLHSEVAAYGLFGSVLWIASGRWKPSVTPPGLLAPMLVMAGIFLHWWSVPLLAQRLLGVACFVVALCLLTMGESWLAKALAWPPLRQMGTWSYSLYLWQQPFYLWAHRDERLPHLLALALAVACGLASFHLVERPARNYLNGHWGVRKLDARRS